MDLFEILSLMNDRFSAFHLLWSFYISVALGLLAYVAVSYTTSSSRLIRLLLVLGFLGFAWVNHGALSSVREQRDSLRSMAMEIYEIEIDRTKRAPSEKEIAIKYIGDFIKEAKPPTACWLTRFHGLLDFIVIMVIVILPGAMSRAKKIRNLDKTPVHALKSEYENPATISRNELKNNWVLTEKFEVKTKEYKFIIPAGFEFDIASIPRMLWWLIAPFELSIAAPLVHDYYYRNGGKPDPTLNPDSTVNPELNRDEVDNVFYEMMRGEGVSWWRSKVAYYSVRVIGDLFWKVPLVS